MILPPSPRRIYGARIAGAPAALVRPGAALALPPAASSADQSALATYVDSQDGASCVEASLENCRWIAVGAKGARADADLWYVGARSRESTRQRAPIADTGSTVSDALDEGVGRGIAVRGDRAGDLSRLDLLDTWDEEMTLARFAPAAFVTLDPGDVGSLDRYLTLGAQRVAAGLPGIGAQIVIPVGQAFEALSTEQYSAAGETALGLHAMCCLDFNPSGYRLWNTYGEAWAAGGFARIARADLARLNLSLTIVLGGPVL